MNVRAVTADDTHPEPVKCPNCGRERLATPGLYICGGCMDAFFVEGEPEVVD